MRVDLTKKQRPLFSVSGGLEVRCPRGHTRVRLSSERDGRGPFLHAWCDEPGCGADAVIRNGVA